MNLVRKLEGIWVQSIEERLVDWDEQIKVQVDMLKTIYRDARCLRDEVKALNKKIKASATARENDAKVIE